MAIKNIVGHGIGFSPSTIKWIVTFGFGSGAAIAGGEEIIELGVAQFRSVYDEITFIYPTSEFITEN